MPMTRTTIPILLSHFPPTRVSQSASPTPSFARAPARPCRAGPGGTGRGAGCRCHGGAAGAAPASRALPAGWAGGTCGNVGAGGGVVSRATADRAAAGCGSGSTGGGDGTGCGREGGEGRTRGTGVTGVGSRRSAGPGAGTGAGRGATGAAGLPITCWGAGGDAGWLSRSTRCSRTLGLTSDPLEPGREGARRSGGLTHQHSPAVSLVECKPPRTLP